MDQEMADEIRAAEAPLFIQCQARSPYSGCWHEPNYWVTKEGKAHPLYVSGIFAQGVDLEFVCNGVDLDFFLQRSVDDGGDRYGEWEHSSLDELDGDCLNPNLLNIITIILHELELPPPKWTCERCDCVVTGLAKYLGYHGNGGIGVVLTDPCCQECFEALRWCDSCHGYVTPVEKTVSVEKLGWGTSIPKVEMKCPEWELASDPEDQEEHLLSEAQDEAAQFGMDGSRFLLRSEGPPPTIIILQKGGVDDLPQV